MIQRRSRSSRPTTTRRSDVVVVLATLAVACLIDVTSASENVYTTSSYNQLVTSSTLRWVTTDSSKSGRAGLGSTVVRVGSIAVCRGWHQNQQVAGGTDDNNRCVVNFFEKKQALDEYQVLVDTTSTSRLEWRYWDRFTKRPLGVVAFTDHAYVARVKRPTADGRERFNVGDLDMGRALSGDIAVGSLDGSDKVDFVTEGEILVEIEPVRYQLKNTAFVRDRAKVSQEVVPLGYKILTNPEPEPETQQQQQQQQEEEEEESENEITNEVEYGDGDDATGGGKVRVAAAAATVNDYKEISGVIPYNATFHYYWGQIPGLIRTLPANGETYNDHGRIDFKWGLPLDYHRHRIRDISHRLLPGTSLNVTAIAIRQTTEVPYAATLVSVFADGQTKERNIESTYQETVFSDVEVSHGAPYFTKNGSATPTTTSRPTPPTTTTTTTSTTTTFTMRTFPLKPLRTTTPMPTSENPLLRFYPQSKEEGEEGQEDAAAGGKDDADADADNGGNYFDDSSSKRVGKHNTRSSPMSDRWMKEGMSSAARTSNAAAAVAVLTAIFGLRSLFVSGQL